MLDYICVCLIYMQSKQVVISINKHLYVNTLYSGNLATVNSTYVPKTSRRCCSVHEWPMLATNSVQLAVWTSLPPAATTASEPGDMGFSDPAGLAIRGLTVIDGCVSAGRPAAGVANGAVDDVSWCCPGNNAGWNYIATFEWLTVWDTKYNRVPALCTEF